MLQKLDMLIVGAQKTGTTSLYDYLAQHPDVFLPKVKEIHYFARDEFYQQGPRYLEAFYRDYKGEAVAGGAYVHLMYFSQSAQRIHDYNPNMHIVAVLRNPIDRAYSAYWYARRNGWENIDSFESALQQEIMRLHGNYQEQAELTYLSHGHYAQQLRPYVELFGADHVHVVMSDELKKTPEKVVDRLLKVLLPPEKQGQGMTLNTSFESNAAGMPKHAWLQRFFLSVDGPHKRLIRAITPQWFRIWVSNHITMPLLNRNIEPFSYPPMQESTRNILREYFAPHNAKLAEMFNLKLDHWQ
ncbi:hypothetical protein GC177_05120 [bacterium]|nr:hypothetical protein [bacterium]